MNDIVRARGNGYAIDHMPGGPYLIVGVEPSGEWLICAGENDLDGLAASGILSVLPTRFASADEALDAALAALGVRR